MNAPSRKILVVGKRGNITHWMENIEAAFRAAGHETRSFSELGDGLIAYAHVKLYRTFAKRRVGEVLAPKFLKTVRDFGPDLIFFVNAWRLPVELYQAAASLPRRPVLAGWVGDRFTETHKPILDSLDRVYHTDSAFLTEAKRMGFRDNGLFLPLAVNVPQFSPMHLPRANAMVFVANRTAHRESVVREITKPVVIYGRHWERMSGTPHDIHARRVAMADLPELYNRYRAVLNVRNEVNVLEGLNQRSFEPAACATPVVNDAMPDLERCFEPGREILVYRNADELNAIYGRLSEDETFAASIGEAAYRRVLAEHTYQHRIETIMSDLKLC